MQCYKQATRDTSSTSRPAGGSLLSIEKVLVEVRPYGGRDGDNAILQAGSKRHIIDQQACRWVAS